MLSPKSLSIQYFMGVDDLLIVSVSVTSLSLPQRDHIKQPYIFIKIEPGHYK
jgi:hypothetical protein